MEEKVKCPVCGKYEFESWNDMDICDVRLVQRRYSK